MLIRRWLYLLWFSVLCMVALGGITRLTGSGLSIVQWKPVTGVMPPLDEATWQLEFDAYRATPQFQKVNAWMALPDFKRIFFWEYLHRLVGRVIGVLVLVPWLYLLFGKHMDRRAAWRTASIFLWGGFQASIGWYMVKSGLVQEPRVSHLRLAMHLVLGMGVGQWILWQALDLREGARRALDVKAASRRWIWALQPMIVLQLIYGAFMAGTHAGLLYPTFPDMNGRYAPAAFFVGTSFWHDLAHSPMAIHYVHRVLALLVTVHVLSVAWSLRGVTALRGASWALLATLAAQVVLGALTVLLHVPVALASAHQICAYLLWSVATVLCHEVVKRDAHA
jgi:heme a synthase